MKLKFWLIHGRKSFHSPSGAAAAPPVRKVNSSRTDHGREVVTNEGKNYRVLTLTCSQFEGFLGHPWNDNAALHSRFEILIESWSMIESIGYRPFSSILLVCKCNGKKRFEIQKKGNDSTHDLPTYPTVVWSVDGGPQLGGVARLKVACILFWWRVLPSVDSTATVSRSKVWYDLVRKCNEPSGNEAGVGMLKWAIRWQPSNRLCRHISRPRSTTVAGLVD